jgi:hypothetical protein
MCDEGLKVTTDPPHIQQRLDMQKSGSEMLRNNSTKCQFHEHFMRAFFV